MKEWWQWSPLQGTDRLGFAVIGVGRFGIAVCRELLQNGADVLAVDRSTRAVDELRQLEPSRLLSCHIGSRLHAQLTAQLCMKPPDFFLLPSVLEDNEVSPAPLPPPPQFLFS